MEKLDWIKELVVAEQKMEESGMIDYSPVFDPEQILIHESVQLLSELKSRFIEASSAFNQMKSSTIGRVKVYGISNTESDFMLFRNGFKLIFSLYEPGLILISFHHAGSTFIPGQGPEGGEVRNAEDDAIEADWGAYGDVNWTYQGKLIKIDYLIKFYLSRFIRESAK